MPSAPPDPSEAASPSGSSFRPPDEVAPIDLLVVGAHPDDAEFGVGGTLVRHHRAGYRIGVLDRTRGELGSKGTATAIRAARPRLVFTHHAEDRHPDHRAAHELVRRAVFAAALSSLDLGVQHHVVPATLCFPTDRVVDHALYGVDDDLAELFAPLMR